MTEEQRDMLIDLLCDFRDGVVGIEWTIDRIAEILELDDDE